MTGRTPGIRQRSKGRWQITVYLHRTDAEGRYERVSRTIQGTKREAESERARMLADIASGAFRRPTHETVASFMARWLDGLGNRAPGTHARYRASIEKHVLPHIGHLTLSSIDAGHINALHRLWREHGLAPGTLRFHHAVIHRAFEDARRWHLITFNPVADVDTPRVQRRQRTVLDPAELRALVATLDAHDFRIAFRLLAHTGMRLGEMLGLRWQDVDLDRGVAALSQQFTTRHTFEPTKSYRSARAIDLDSTLVALLRAHKAEQNTLRLRVGKLWRNLDLVVCDGIGQPLTHSQVDHAFKTIVRRSGLPDNLHPHDLRHAHASHLLALGVDVRTVADRLGHASAAFTLSTYIHTVSGKQLQAAERFASNILEADSTSQQASNDAV